MRRFVLVIAVVVAVITLTLLHLYALALTLGVVAGAAMFLLGMAAGGGLGNARSFERKPADVGARIGVAVAAMGIAVEGLRPDHYYPPQFRIFCGVCQGLGAVIALVLAARALRQSPVMKK
jgi:hypothetical protein